MRVWGRMPRGAALVLLIVGLASGAGSAAWASEGAAPGSPPPSDGSVAPVSEVVTESADAPGAPLLVEGAWFVLEVHPGQILLTVKSDAEGGADVVFEIPALRTRNHGGYVSALATALEPGPRRGQIVSALARSSAGRPDKPQKADKSNGRDKPEKVDRPDGPGTSDEIGEADDGEDDAAIVGEDGEDGGKEKALGKDKAPGKDKAHGKDKSPAKAQGSSRGD